MVKKSPTGDRARRALSQIKDEMDNGPIKGMEWRYVALYSLCVFLTLLILQPSVVTTVDYSRPIDDPESVQLSYRRLAVWVLIFHLPLLFYITFMG